ncbi:putative TetR family transcriptional regulator [Gordonia effusa NBRC 100432]|uniref:Putative TetR family transcriptional regulator n=1 Tax=Gordonia effusa NBRC 100432 TaxID=1077974 RepID=H0R017_9ACTN|nr:TetR/AcrR family transcriptional regulator [Gordonia effusa]GAB18418.1 putative TetR family transcriptional regulator [Gordonia effusa NBRC 100432]
MSQKVNNDEQRLAQRNYRGESAASRRAHRRRALLEAGRGLWASDGLDKVSVRKVCAAAGVADRYFYEEFNGIEAFTAQVARAAYQQLLERMTAEATAVTGPVKAQLRAGMAGFILGAVADPSVVAVLATETPRRPDLRAERHAAQEAIAQYIQASLGITEPTPQSASRALFAVVGITGLIERWYDNQDPQHLDELTEFGVSVCLDLISST